MSDEYQATYVTGFLDGLLSGVFLGTTQSCVDKVLRCIEGKSPAQMAAMIRKHLKDRPDKWHELASPQAFIALIGQCKL